MNSLRCVVESWTNKITPALSSFSNEFSQGSVSSAIHLQLLWVTGQSGPLDKVVPWTKWSPGQSGPLDKVVPWTKWSPGQSGALDKVVPWTKWCPGQSGALDIVMTCSCGQSDWSLMYRCLTSVKATHNF